MVRKKNAGQYILLYTIVFGLFYLGTFFPFFIERRSFVWNMDGLPQYLPYRIYLGRLIREFVKRALHGDFHVQMFDYTIGFGSEAGIALRPYLPDLLSALVPERYAEALYNFLTACSLYLAGLSFSGFCHHRKKDWDGILTGSMVYVFCGYTMRLGLEHPLFQFPLIYFPLFLLFTDRIIEGGSGLWLSLSVFAGWTCGVNGIYMATAGLGLYLLFLLPGLLKERKIKGVFVLALKIGGAYLLGLCMAGIFFTPFVSSISRSARGGKEGVRLFYGSGRISSILLNLFTPYLSLSNKTYLNFSVTVFPALAALFMSRRRRGMLKAAVIASFLILLFPPFGYVMGLTYLNGRWVFLMAMAAGCCVVFAAPDFTAFTGRRAAALGALLIGYAGFILLRGSTPARQIYTRPALVLLIVLCLFLLAASHIRSLREYVPLGVLTLTFIGCVMSGLLTYGHRFGREASEYIEAGTCYEKIKSSPMQLLANRYAMDQASEETGGFVRYETAESVFESDSANYPMVFGYPGLSAYNSFLHASAMEFLTDQESTGANAVHRISGLAGRTVDETIFSVGYFLARKGETTGIPYGFVPDPAISHEDYTVYRNENLLSFGFAQDTCMRREYYETLSGVEKEQALLYAAVTDEIPEGMKEMTELPINLIREEIPLPASGRDLTRTETGYRATDRNAVLTIPVKRRAGYECYLRLTGLKKNGSYIPVRVNTGDLSSVVPVRGSGRTYALKRENYSVRLGFDAADSDDRAEIVFPEKGNYRFGGIELWYVPMDGYAARVRELNETAMSETTVTDNTVTGRIETDVPRIVVISLPWMDGWSAAVDGEKTDILKTDAGLMGITVRPGSHSICLTYETPLLRVGAIATAAGWISFFVIQLWSARGKKRRMQKRQNV